MDFLFTFLEGLFLIFVFKNQKSPIEKRFAVSIVGFLVFFFDRILGVSFTFGISFFCDLCQFFLGLGCEAPAIEEIFGLWFRVYNHNFGNGGENPLPL